MKKLVFSILIFILLFLFLNQIVKVDGIPLNDINLPYTTLSKPSTITLSTTIKVDKLYSYLFFGKVSASKIKILVENDEIFELGTVSGNLWPKAIVVKIPEKFYNKKVNLKVILFGVYDIGIHYTPVLTDQKAANLHATLIKVFRQDFYIFSQGITFIVGIILILSSLKFEKNIEKSIFYTGLSSIFTFLMLFDFQFRAYSGDISTFIFFRKIFISSAVLALCFNVIGFSSLLNKNKKIFLLPTLILLSIFFAFNSLSSFNLLISILNVYIIILSSSIFYLVYKNKLKIFYFSTNFLILSILQTIYLLFTKASSEIMLTYGIVIFRTGISLILIKKFEEIVKEKENLKDLTFVDPMTQLFNRNIIENIPNKGKLILIDLDNFKELNDALGHQFGDKILKEFADILKENTRSTDYVIRLGGDEFAIVTDTENPEQLVNRIRKNSIKKLKLDFSYGISNNFNFDKAYSVADKRLYTMKNEKKKLKK